MSPPMEIEKLLESEPLEQTSGDGSLRPRDEWISITITPQSKLFPLIQKAADEMATGNIELGQKTATVEVINIDRSKSLRTTVTSTYKLLFDWQGKRQYSVEVFKKGEDKYGTDGRIRKQGWGNRPEQDPVSDGRGVRSRPQSGAPV